MRSSIRVLAGAMIVLHCGAAYADATLQPVMGGALVSHGQGYQRVTTESGLRLGDRVMVSEGNGATLTYPDGCKLDIRPGAVHIVRPVSPCAMGQDSQDARELCLRARTEEERDRLHCPAGLFGATGLAVAAGAIALGGAAAAIALTQGDDNKNTPVSP